MEKFLNTGSKKKINLYFNVSLPILQDILIHKTNQFFYFFGKK